MSPLFSILLIVVAIAANAYMLVDLLDRRATERATIRELVRSDLYRVQRAADLRRRAGLDEEYAAHRAAQGCHLIAAHYRGAAATMRDRAARLEAMA